jgi:hypothetical protein
MISLEDAEHLVKHQFRNEAQADVEFLVISVHSTREDRVNPVPVA